MSKKIAILGGGVSGIAMGRILYDRDFDVTVYEKNPTIGGLARTKIIDGYTFDLHGGHLFGTKNKQIKEWVFSMYPKENWEYHIRNVKIFMQGQYITYPFESGLCELSTDFAIDCALDYIEGQQGEAPDIYYDWLEWQFGKTIADYYMRPYNSKIWAYPLKNMETEWVHGKMPISSKREILASLVNRETAEKNFVHSSFYYPKHGGIQSMVDAIAQPLSDKIRLNTAVGKIEKRGGKWQINGTDEYDVVISTLPIVEMPNMMTLPDEISKAISGLTFNSHTSVLFSCPPTNLHWLYIPESKYKSHRICYQSAACANATPNQSMGSGTLEVIGNKFDIPSDFALDNAVIPQELGAKQQITTAHAEYAYVVHSIGYKKNTEIFRAYFEGVEHFHLLGRWALWHYSNMDINMADAFKLADAYFQKR